MIRVHGIALFTGLAIITQPVAAAVADYCPRGKDGKVNPAVEIDKNIFATSLLDTAGVTVGLAGRVLSLGVTSGLTPFESILVAGPSVCAAPDPVHPDAPPPPHKIKCSDQEIAALTKAQHSFTLALPTLTVANAPTTGPLLWDAFFGTAAIAARCKAPTGELVTKTPKAPQTPTSLDRWAITNFRARGTPADILYEHGSPGFDVADPVKLNIGSDSGKWSKAFVGTLGYAYPLIGRQDPVSLTYTDASIVPFFGIDLEESRNAPDPKSVDSNTISFGAAFQYEETYTYKRMDGMTRDWASWYIGVAPKAVFNDKDKSRVLGVDLTYRPAGDLVIFPHVVALPFNKSAGIGSAPFTWHLVLDGRWNSGTFLRQGARSLDASRDFSRIGVRGGIAFSTYGAFKVPIDFTITDTYMFLTLAGEPGELSRLNGNLTIYFTEDKIFGLQLGYARGRIEDLDGRDDKWSLALTAKY